MPMGHSQMFLNSVGDDFPCQAIINQNYIIKPASAMEKDCNSDQQGLWETRLLLTTSRGCSPAAHMSREHSSAMTTCVPPAAQGKPEHCAPV